MLEVYSLDKHTGSHEPLCENSEKGEKPCRVLHYNFVCQPLQMCVCVFGLCSDPINRAHVCPSTYQCCEIQQRTQWAKCYGCKQNYIHLNDVQLAPFGFLRLINVRGSQLSKNRIPLLLPCSCQVLVPRARFCL